MNKYSHVHLIMYSSLKRLGRVFGKKKKKHLLEREKENYHMCRSNFVINMLQQGLTTGIVCQP